MKAPRSLPRLENQSSIKNSPGFRVSEAHNYVTQNQNEFYASTKVFFKPNVPSITALNINKQASAPISHTTQTEESPVSINRNKFYQYSTPDYMRVSALDRLSSKSIVSLPTDPSPQQQKEERLPVTVVSRVNGWLTVDPVTLSRKMAIEKSQKINVRNTSKLAPPWMITDQSPDVKTQKMFKKQSVVGHNVRFENNRIVLAETNQVPKSIFNINQMRHDVMRPEDAGIINGKPPTGKPSRLIEWQENNMERQTYDKKITPKIGQSIANYTLASSVALKKGQKL